MTTQLEQAARQALKALEFDGFTPEDQTHRAYTTKAITALRTALEQPAQDCQHCGGTGDVSGEYPGVACPECTGTGVKTQPEFITHEVENAEDWSEWVCPDPKGYLMRCCDCGLVHEAEFKVVRYKSETELEECEPVDDPNLQAVFRMRRSEQWSPGDTAHRAGGLPMEQPAQDEPVAWQWLDTGNFRKNLPSTAERSAWRPLYTRHQAREWVGLTDEELRQILSGWEWDCMKAVEAKLKEKNNG